MIHIKWFMTYILKRTMLTPKIPFSDFEHDTNRKYTEEVTKDFSI